MNSFRRLVNYSSTDLSGSVASGSVVVRTFVHNHYGHYLINGSYKDTSYESIYDERCKIFLETRRYLDFAKPTDISVGDYLFDKDGNEVEVTSVSEVGEDNPYYSLDVEDIDTYLHQRY